MYMHILYNVYIYIWPIPQVVRLIDTHAPVNRKEEVRESREDGYDRCICMCVYIYIYIIILMIMLMFYIYIYIHTYIKLLCWTMLNKPIQAYTRNVRSETMFIVICQFEDYNDHKNKLITRGGLIGGTLMLLWQVTGVCETNTHPDGAGVFNVPTPLPLFQSWRQDTPQQLTKLSVVFTDRLHSPCACPWTLTLGGGGGESTLTTSRMSVDFSDAGITPSPTAALLHEVCWRPRKPDF